MANKRRSRQYKDYGLMSFISGLVSLTLVNITLGIMMHNVFGTMGIIGIFSIVENLFVIMLVTNRNYENIQYFKEKTDKLQKEINKLKKEISKKG